MLKSIGTTCSESTEKQENKVSYNTDNIVSDLNDFFGDDWKEIKTQPEKRNIIIVKNIVQNNKNWFFVSNFWEFPKTMQKNNVPLHGVVGPCGVVHQSLIFWGKNLTQKMGKMDQERAKIRVFWIYWKI